MGASGRPDVARDVFVCAVEAIYDAAPDPSRWPYALQKIADAFDDVGAVLIWQRDDGGFGTIASPGLAAAQRDYEGNQWHRRDLPATRAVERSLWLSRDAVTDRHAVSDEEVETHPFYTEFLARHGLKWRVAVGVAPDPHVSVAISVQRAATRQPYSDEELEVATRLGRHAEKSLRLSIRLLDAEYAKFGLGEALSRVGIGVLALDALGRVTFSNPAGERLFGDGLDLREGFLRIRPTPARDKIEKTIARALAGEPEHMIDERPMLIERAQSSRPLAVYVLPIRGAAQPQHAFLTHTRAIVLAIDPASDDPPDPTLVRDLLGLTLGEARIAALVGSGLAPRETAERLGITEETTRTALKRVFSKVGVSRQSELAALLARLVLR